MSWKTIKKALANKDMRKRIGIVVLLIVIYRALAHIPIPIGEPAEVRQLIDNLFSSQALIGYLDLLSGGALANFSIMLMGLGPYITASIVMQLLTKAVPKFEEMSKEGEAGRRRINQYTRWLTLPLAIIQAVGVIILLRQQAGGVTGTGDILGSPSLFEWLVMIATLTGASMLLMWFGELITEQGIGNGISLLIFAGIISQLPQIAGTVTQSVGASFSGGIQYSVFGWFTVPFNVTALLILLGFILAGLLITYWVVKLNEAQRTVTVSYAKRISGNRAYGGVNTVLPIKLIIAGVVPIIFASAFLAVPSFIGQLLQGADPAWMQSLGSKLIAWFTGPGTQTTQLAQDTNLVYPVSFFLLVVIFTYFYTGIVFNAKEIAENLQKQGGFIGGLRPGNQTEHYLRKVVNRLTLFGAVSLGFLALLPYLGQRFLGAAGLTLGGTGLLIVVAVAIETLRQIESKALMVTYDQEYRTPR